VLSLLCAGDELGQARLRTQQLYVSDSDVSSVSDRSEVYAPFDAGDSTREAVALNREKRNGTLLPSSANPVTAAESRMTADLAGLLRERRPSRTCDRLGDVHPARRRRWSSDRLSVKSRLLR
jgi:hypothetical protein